LLGIAATLTTLTIHQVLHRDINPANVLISDEFVGDCHPPLVADYGHSGAFPDPSQGVAFTSGSPGFLAPEVSEKEGANWSEKSDVFAFGILAVCLITHTRSIEMANEANSHSYGRAALAQPRLEQSGELRFLTPLVLRLLADLPDDRPKFARVLEDLQEIAADFIDSEVREYLTRFDYGPRKERLPLFRLSFGPESMDIMKIMKRFFHALDEIDISAEPNEDKRLGYYMRAMIIDRQRGLQEVLADFVPAHAVLSPRTGRMKGQYSDLFVNASQTTLFLSISESNPQNFWVMRYNPTFFAPQKS
jgi:serine/threonine protein kinase